MRILLIEDNPMIGNSLTKALRDLGMSVDWITDGLDGEEALAAIARHRPDMIERRIDAHDAGIRHQSVGGLDPHDARP